MAGNLVQVHTQVWSLPVYIFVISRCNIFRDEANKMDA